MPSPGHSTSRPTSSPSPRTASGSRSTADDTAPRCVNNGTPLAALIDAQIVGTDNAIDAVFDLNVTDARCPRPRTAPPVAPPAAPPAAPAPPAPTPAPVAPTFTG